MKPLKPDAYALLKLIIELTPFTTRVIAQTRLRDVNKWKRWLVRNKLAFITGEDGQWERLWPTEGGKLMYEWQKPLAAERLAPEVVNLYKIEKDWQQREIYVYVGRAGKGLTGTFCNPVEIGKDCPFCGQVHAESGDTLPCYEQYLRKKIADDLIFRVRVKGLLGRKLVCFCAPKPCHGKVLAQVCGELNA